MPAVDGPSAKMMNGAGGRQDGHSLTNSTSGEQPSRLPRPQRRESPAPLAQPLGAAPRRSRPASRPPVPQPVYEDEYDEADAYYQPQRESLLRNPYVLAAVAVAGAIVMAIVVVAMAGGGGGGGGGNTQAPASSSLTPQPGGATVESIATATVREGPGTEWDQIGTLPRGQKVVVTGRDADSKWYQIVFPQNSTLRGWVPSTALKASDLNAVGIAVVPVTPLSRPTPIPPTPVPQPTEAATATATVTSTALPGPDLAVSIGCTPGSSVAVTISNVGDVPVQGRTATVSVAIGGQVRSTSQVPLNLNPKESVTFPTSETVSPPVTTVVLTLQGSPAETDTSDNTASCQLGATTPTPGSGGTSTPAASTPTPSLPAPTATP